jgi:asparagine synthase (glutamine-hydrolysing)
MCGICGICFSDRARPVSASVIGDMTASLHHRGPDDEGIHIDGAIGFGHRRLSIIDLSSAGRQPMISRDGRYVLVFNGEIYNYRELRQELTARGETFDSSTDTEVLLRLYARDGEACLSRLVGMFAFAVWDARERRLFAARDHFGDKPFYYATGDGWFAFASEIKALFRTGLITPELHGPGLADYITFQFCLDDKTMFRQVRKLMPGHYLTVSASGDMRVHRYWQLDFAIDGEHDEQFFRDRLTERLEDAVRLQMRADVPLGAHLSGGLDSSAVASLATRIAGRPISVFSGAFREGPQYDETPYARLMAAHLGADHHEVYPTAQDFVSHMPRLIYHMDEPAAGPGLFPQFCVSQLARRHVKVVLGGQGGDEVFGGYIRYLIAYLEECIKGGINGTQHEEDARYVVTLESILPNLRQLQGYEPLLRHFWGSGLFAPAEERYLRLIDRSEGVREFIVPDLLPPSSEYDPVLAFREAFHAHACGSLINRLTWFDIQTQLPALLQVEDRTSMAVGLESRIPLLDHRIVELVASMPPKVKYQGGRSKYIFREAVRQMLPPAIYQRADKMGFPVPLQEWYQVEPVRSFVADALLAARGENFFVRTGALESLVDRTRPYGRGTWGLLCLELWRRTFLDGAVDNLAIGAGHLALSAERQDAR